ncbi:MAG: hypothetical protein Q7S15_01990 [bacterium]|nr:hypothetical protein [bacterium]
MIKELRHLIERVYSMLEVGDASKIEDYLCSCYTELVCKDLVKALEFGGNIEKFLSIALDWLLKRVGYRNMALWLKNDDGEYLLGAYMRYTVSSNDLPLNLLCESILARARPIVRILGKDLPEPLSKILADYELLAAPIDYHSDTTAIIVLFDKDGWVNEERAHILECFSRTFTAPLSRYLNYEIPEDDYLKDGESGTDSPRNSADWWKRGEDPPY